MDHTFEVITADEHDRLLALYQPLAQSVRGLIDASIRTGVDENTIRDAQAAIESVTETLAREKNSGTGMVRLAESGRPVAWSNPVIGVRNAFAPPLTVQHDGNGAYWSEFSLGAAYEGPPGLAHGGICALVLDHILGEAASEGLTKPLFTGTITCRYLRGTPLGPLRVEAIVERTEGIKTFARGQLSDSEGVTVEAEGVFIMPVWARDAAPMAALHRLAAPTSHSTGSQAGRTT